jgi:hypothetical protein
MSAQEISLPLRLFGFVPALTILIVALFDEIPESSYAYLSTSAIMTHLELPPTTHKISDFPCVPESSRLHLIGSFNQIPEISCISPRLHTHHEAHTTPRTILPVCQHSFTTASAQEILFPGCFGFVECTCPPNLDCYFVRRNSGKLICVPLHARNMTHLEFPPTTHISLPLHP